MTNDQLRTGSFVKDVFDFSHVGYVIAMKDTHAQVYYSDLCGSVWMPFNRIETTDDPEDIEKLFDR